MKAILDQEEWEEYQSLKRHNNVQIGEVLDSAKAVIAKLQFHETSGNRVIPGRAVIKILNEIDKLKPG